MRDEGVGGLFTGAGPTVVRAMAHNMGMLASNDQAKEMLVAAGVSPQASVVGGATIAGFFAAACRCARGIGHSCRRERSRA